MWIRLIPFLLRSRNSDTYNRGGIDICNRSHISGDSPGQTPNGTSTIFQPAY